MPSRGTLAGGDTVHRDPAVPSSQCPGLATYCLHPAQVTVVLRDIQSGSCPDVSSTPVGVPSTWIPGGRTGPVSTPPGETELMVQLSVSRTGPHKMRDWMVQLSVSRTGLCHHHPARDWMVQLSVSRTGAVPTPLDAYVTFLYSNHTGSHIPSSWMVHAERVFVADIGPSRT